MMMRFILNLVPVWMLVLGSSLVVSTARADSNSVDTMIKNASELTENARRSQQRINAMDDATRELYGEFQLENRRLEDLKVYNAQMRRQIKNQQAKIQEIQKTLKDISIIERQIAPTLARMIYGLEQFIELDVPFLLEERRKRVARLKDILERADVTMSEKIRQLAEAYQIEQDYSNTIETYKGQLNFGEETKEVEFLRIGRIGLIYQTLDGKAIGAWNNKTKAFEPVDKVYRRDIRKGLKMAKKQVAPDLLKLPMLMPTKTEAQ